MAEKNSRSSRLPRGIRWMVLVCVAVLLAWYVRAVADKSQVARAAVLRPEEKTGQQDERVQVETSRPGEPGEEGSSPADRSGPSGVHYAAASSKFGQVLVKPEPFPAQGIQSHLEKVPEEEQGYWGRLLMRLSRVEVGKMLDEINHQLLPQGLPWMEGAAEEAHSFSSSKSLASPYYQLETGKKEPPAAQSGASDRPAETPAP